MPPKNRSFAPAFVLLALALWLAACAPPGPPLVASPGVLHTPDPADELRSRPLQLIKIEAGSQCPSAHPRQVNPDYGVAVGEGPVYAAGFGNDGVLSITFPAPTETPFYGSAWSGTKVLWFVDPAYQGPVLIRGGQLDGPNSVRFNTGADLPSELWIDAAGSSNWRSQATYTRLRLPGCYMYQVDGTNFTETIIFEAKAQP